MKSTQSASRGEPRSIVWIISRRLGMVIVLALAFSLSALVTIYTLFRSGDTRVPNVIGQPESTAQKMAEDAGLNVRIQRRNDDAVPANTVIETRPGPNSSVKKESALVIVVSNGPSQPRSEARLGTSERPPPVNFSLIEKIERYGMVTLSGRPLMALNYGRPLQDQTYRIGR